MRRQRNEWGTMVDDWMVRGLLCYIRDANGYTRRRCGRCERRFEYFLNFEMGVRASCHTVPSPSENPLTSGRPSVRRGLVAAKWNPPARCCSERILFILFLVSVDIVHCSAHTILYPLFDKLIFRVILKKYLKFNRIFKKHTKIYDTKLVS